MFESMLLLVTRGWIFGQSAERDTSAPVIFSNLKAAALAAPPADGNSLRLGVN
jgi:hypothetical protein